MKYETYICTHEYEIIAETFEFENHNRNVCDQKRRYTYLLNSQF